MSKHLMVVFISYKNVQYVAIAAMMKRYKPAPCIFQPPLVPFVVGPGYILSKSKSKFAVLRKDGQLNTPPKARAPC